MKLSIIITTLNEAPFELNQTIASIRETAGDKPEILVVDDQSSTPVECEDKAVRVIHNRWRCGVGPSRHIGACAATGEFILIIDSHMRFTPGWYEKAVARLEGRPTTVHCATCLGLDRDHMDIKAPTAKYHGATMNFYGPDKNKAGAYQVFESVWLTPEPADDDLLPSIMGACYFWPREWFLKLAPLRYIKLWGQDEPLMAIKSWLAGGDVRLMKQVEIGHVFWTAAKPVIKKQFTVPPGYTNWNKLFAIHTLCPPDVAETLTSKLVEHEPNGDMVSAIAMLRDDWRTVATEQAFNRTIFKHDIRWFASKFGLTLP